MDKQKQMLKLPPQKKTMPHFKDLVTYESQREITEIRYERNNIFEARKIVECLNDVEHLRHWSTEGETNQ